MRRADLRDRQKGLVNNIENSIASLFCDLAQTGIEIKELRIQEPKNKSDPFRVELLYTRQPCRDYLGSSESEKENDTLNS